MRFMEMTLSGAGMVVVIVVIRALAMNCLPKKVFLFLWGTALLRLLVPFSISSPFSIYTAVTAIAGHTGGMAAVPGPVPEEAGQGFPLITAVWLGGMVLCGLYFILAYGWNLRKFRAAKPLSFPFLNEWLLRQNFRRPVQVCVSGRVSAPLTYGLFRPVILLPSGMEWEDSEQLRYILTHESVHIRRLDTLSKILLMACACIHWFNPFCWVMFLLANRDLEISCDEAVVKILGRKKKSSYAMTLIEMEEQSAALPLFSHFSKNALEERVTAILKGRRASWYSVAVSSILVLTVMAVFSTSAYAAGITPAPPQDKEASNPVSTFAANLDLLKNIRVPKAKGQETPPDTGLPAEEKTVSILENPQEQPAGLDEENPSVQPQEESVLVQTEEASAQSELPEWHLRETTLEIDPPSGSEP